MKKKISVPMVVFLVHFLVCAFLSFDLPFLEGIYMGFVPTFLIVWGITLPIVTSCISVISVVIQASHKKKLSILEILTAVVGCVILLIYLSSASGLIKQLELDFIYVFVFVGMFFVWGCWFYKKIKKR